MFVKSVLATLAVAGAAVAQTINSPATLTTCVPAQITWTGGQSPYYVSVIPGGQPSAAPYESFPQQTGTSYTWTVNLPANTDVTLKLTDSAGVTVYSSKVTIMAGSSTSCVNSTASTGSSTSGSSSSSGSSSAAASGSSAAASGSGSSSAAASMSTNASGSGSATAAGSSASATASKAASSASKLVVGGVAGLVLAACGMTLA